MESEIVLKFELIVSLSNNTTRDTRRSIFRNQISCFRKYLDAHIILLDIRYYHLFNYITTYYLLPPPPLWLVNIKGNAPALSLFDLNLEVSEPLFPLKKKKTNPSLFESVVT